MPTGIFYAQGVKANVLFFDAKPAQEAPWTKKLWVYDLRTNMHFTQKERPLKRADLGEFHECFNPENRHKRQVTWAETAGKGGVGPDGRWRMFEYDALIKRDKANVDIFWLKDDSLADGENLPEPDVLAAEIVEDLEDAVELFQKIASGLNSAN